MKRQCENLSSLLEHRLNLYALAAGAAGVGVLAFTQPAEGKVVYTKTHWVIQRGDSYKLDLNHDKVIDFTVANFVSCTALICGYFLQLRPTRGNSAVGYTQRFLTYASALKPGFRIDARRHFQTLSANMVIHTSKFTGGPWVNVTDRYLGLRFQIKGETHYGWARMNVRVHGANISATLTGYAYETIPNKPIIAGKTKGSDVITLSPASLGRLAQGSGGLAAWRSAQ